MRKWSYFTTIYPAPSSHRKYARCEFFEAIKAQVAERSELIELLYQPSYSPPHLDPEERLNADFKQVMSKRVPVRTKVKLRETASEHNQRKVDFNSMITMNYT